MKLVKCQSCGAGLQFNKCSYCGAYHHGEIAKLPRYHLSPSLADYEMDAATGMFATFYGYATVNHELIVKLV